jgi:adenylate cyclase, class 2
MTNSTQEIECRFLEIDKKALIEKLYSIGAKDLGEVQLEEIIMYDSALTWIDENRFVRLRKSSNKITLSYKEHKAHTIDGTYELEFEISNLDQARLLCEKLGLKVHRYQNKLRHSFAYKNVVFDIDTWPQIPAYVEIEGPDEQSVKDAAGEAGLDWNNVRFENAGVILEGVYKIPFKSLHWFTFEKVE